jgi:hypothetical protein
MSCEDEAIPITPDVLVRSSNYLRKRPALFRESLGTVPVIERASRSFAVRLADISEPHRSATNRVCAGASRIGRSLAGWRRRPGLSLGFRSLGERNAAVVVDRRVIARVPCARRRRHLASTYRRHLGGYVRSGRVDVV